MKEHCRKLEISFVDLCSDSWKPSPPNKKRKVNKKRSSKGNGYSDYSSPMAEEMNWKEKVVDTSSL